MLRKHILSSSNVEVDFLLSLCSHSDSPHSEPGTIDEADNGTEPHTSDEGQHIIVAILYLFPMNGPRCYPVPARPQGMEMLVFVV